MRIRAMIVLVAGMVAGFVVARLDTPWWLNLAVGTTMTWFVCALFPERGAQP